MSPAIPRLIDVDEERTLGRFKVFHAGVIEPAPRIAAAS
jgi:hypothetical protein